MRVVPPSRALARRAFSAMCAGASAPPLASPPPVRHFVNLSNGAEALPLLAAAGVPPDQVGFCRIQSSHCEAQDFYGVLSNLDHNLLMHLALGFECRIYDFGSRGNVWEYADGSTEQLWVPRALWWGVEWSRYALETLWRLPEPRKPPLLRGYNVRRLFDDKLRAVPKPLWKRLKYYRAHLAPDLPEVRLRGIYAGTVLDGDKAAYGDFLRAHTARCSATQAAAGAALAAPAPDTLLAAGGRDGDGLEEGAGGGGRGGEAREGVPMRFYDAQTMMRVGMGPSGWGQTRPAE